MGGIGPYRAGHKVKRNIYKNDVPVAMVATEEEAAELVALLNIGHFVQSGGDGTVFNIGCPAGECNGAKLSGERLARLFKNVS